MKRTLSNLARLYAFALRKYLKQGPQTSLQPARGLGQKAAALGLETLDIARIHEEALFALKVSNARDGIRLRAENFFTEAITPIEKTHGAALKASAHLSHVNKTLDRRTVDLAAANRCLTQSIRRRKNLEEALKESGGNSKGLLEESRRLQKHLRHLTHQILTAQEDKRKKVSRELHAEIAQTLVGINVRLVTLKKEATVSAAGLQKEIASTRRLVDKSMKSINQFTRGFGKDHQK